MCCTLVYTLFCQLYFFVRDIRIVHLFYLILRPYRTRVFVILGSLSYSTCVSEPLNGRIQFYTPIDRSTSFLEDSLRCPCAYCVVRWSVFGKRVHGIRKIAATHCVISGWCQRGWRLCVDRCPSRVPALLETIKSWQLLCFFCIYHCTIAIEYRLCVACPVPVEDNDLRSFEARFAPSLPCWRLPSAPCNRSLIMS